MKKNRKPPDKRKARKKKAKALLTAILKTVAVQKLIKQVLMDVFIYGEGHITAEELDRLFLKELDE